MIDVAFKGDETIIKSDQHVYQWDTGQKIMVSGLGNSSINQVHFSFNGLKTAYPVNVTNSSGTVTVNIPNIVLRYGKDVYMYLCIKNTNGTVVTIKTVIIPVIKRNMPENYMYDDNETVAVKLDELQTEIQRSTAVDTEHENRFVTLENDLKSDLSHLEINSITGSLKVVTSKTHNQGAVHQITGEVQKYEFRISDIGNVVVNDNQIKMQVKLADNTIIYKTTPLVVSNVVFETTKPISTIQVYTDTTPTSGGTILYSIVSGYGLSLCSTVKTNSEIIQADSPKLLAVGTKTIGLNEEHSIQVTAGEDIKTINYPVYILKGTKYTVTITPSELNSVSTIAFYRNGKAVAYPKLTNGAWTYTETATEDITKLGINNTKEYNTKSCTITYKIESVGLVSEVNQNTVDIKYTKTRSFGLTSENTIAVTAGAEIKKVNFYVYIPKGTEYSVTITPSELNAVGTISFFKNNRVISYPKLTNGAYKFSEIADEDIVTLGINNTKNYNTKNCTVSFDVVAKGITNEIGDILSAVQPTKPAYANTKSTVNASKISLEETYIEIGSRLTAVLTWNDSFGNINVGRGKSTFRGMWLNIDSTNCNIYIKDYVTGDEQSGTTLSDKLSKTYTHGLALKSPLTVIIESDENGGSIKRTIKLVNGDGNVFSQQLTGISGATGTPFVESVSGRYNADLSFTTSNYDKKIWLYGDSYFEYRWLPTLRSWGHTNFLADYRAGQASAEAYRALTNAFKHGNPKIVVWAEGMNDSSDSNESTPSSTWLSNVQNVISLCSSKGADVVLCTIPSVYYNGSYIKDHRAKNAWIRSSGYRYCDFASILEDGNGNWFDGLKNAGDDIHPSTLGCNVMAAYAMNKIPEITD